MFKSFLMVFAFILLAFSGKASATISTFYFKIKSGAEVRVDIVGSSDNPNFIFFNTVNMDESELFRQYVDASVNRLTYIYVDDPCGRDCNGSYYQTPDKIYTNNYTAAQVPAFLSKNALANKAVEGAISQLGSRSVDAVVNALTANSDPKTSPYLVVSNNQDVPYLMCKMANGSCEILDDVTFTQLSNGWGAVYPVAELGTSNEAHNNQIYQALRVFVTRVEVTCKTVYTGSPGRLLAQVTCYAPH